MESSSRTQKKKQKHKYEDCVNETEYKPAHSIRQTTKPDTMQEIKDIDVVEHAYELFSGVTRKNNLEEGRPLFLDTILSHHCSPISVRQSEFLYRKVLYNIYWQVNENHQQRTQVLRMFRSSERLNPSS